MTAHGLVLFGLVFLLAAATPGPGIAAIVGRVLSSGPSGVGGFIAGFVVADLVWLSLAASGMAALARTAHTPFVLAKFAGAGYLLYLAYRSWSAPVRPIATGSNVSDREGWRLFVGGITLTLGNPQTMVVFLALIPTVVDLSRVTLTAFCQLAIMICVILSLVLTLYAFAAMHARRLFQTERPARLLNRISGTLMAGAAIVLASR